MNCIRDNIDTSVNVYNNNIKTNEYLFFVVSLSNIDLDISLPMSSVDTKMKFTMIQNGVNDRGLFPNLNTNPASTFIIYRTWQLEDP